MQRLTEEMRREKESFVAEKESLSDLLVRADDILRHSASQQLIFS